MNRIHSEKSSSSSSALQYKDEEKARMTPQTADASCARTHGSNRRQKRALVSSSSSDDESLPSNPICKPRSQAMSVSLRKQNVRQSSSSDSESEDIEHSQAPSSPILAPRHGKAFDEKESEIEDFPVNHDHKIGIFDAGVERREENEEEEDEEEQELDDSKGTEIEREKGRDGGLEAMQEMVLDGETARDAAERKPSTVCFISAITIYLFICILLFIPMYRGKNHFLFYFVFLLHV